jgi:hypothetical protein
MEEHRKQTKLMLSSGNKHMTLNLQKYSFQNATEYQKFHSWRSINGIIGKY